MRTWCIILAISLQFAVLLYMAGEREYVVRSGKTIYLRTSPLDPRDLFRGDYVRLSYEISSIPVGQVRGLPKEERYRKGRRVYSVLKEGTNGLWNLAYCTADPPEQGVYLRGRIGDDWRFAMNPRAMNVKYSIEAYYVQQGKGKVIEQHRGMRQGVQIPMEMEVAVSDSGLAILKGYRWSPLGLGLRIVEAPKPNRSKESNERKTAKLELTLKNASSRKLAVVDLKDHCSFSLEPVAWARTDWRPAQSVCTSVEPEDGDVIVLGPDEVFRFQLDMADPRWHVLKDGKPVEIGTLDWSGQYRLVYRPPSEERCSHLADKDLIWHGYLPSRAFHGAGRID